jgi:predicted DsbA family dithiol-disulfide isomerase
MKIKVFADTICGWCYIGHARLNKALEEFKDIKFEIEHMPFQLNPDMPKKDVKQLFYKPLV